MTHHPLTKLKKPFSVSMTTKQPILTISLPSLSSMVAVPYICGCIILSLNAGPLSVSHSNRKMLKLSLHTKRMVTEQNVATVLAYLFPLWQARCWPNSCSPDSWSVLWILSHMNINVVSGMGAAQLTWYLLPGNIKKNAVNSIKTMHCQSRSNKCIWCSQTKPSLDHST